MDLLVVLDHQEALGKVVQLVRRVHLVQMVLRVLLEHRE
jgi:hypothetical protein